MFRLFHVKGGVMGRCRAVEVDAKSRKLNSNDAFVLITPNGNYAWFGKGDAFDLTFIAIYLLLAHWA